MKTDIREYARIGLVHHLLYPECTTDPDFHVETLLALAQRDDIEIFDCCIPYGSERRQRVVRAIRACGKEVVYALHLFPMQKISLGSLRPQEQAQTRMIVKDQIEMAVAIKAAGLIFGSGADVPENRADALRAFGGFCRWVCAEIKPHGMRALIEPFDRTVDKRFLLGPTSECAAFIRSLAPEEDNLGIELDLAHLPLMGESFAAAVKNVAPYLHHVHLGNCVLKDKSNPWHGDRHPPIGFEGGEINVPELAEFLGILVEHGYLSRAKRNRMVFEMRPFPNLSVEETIQDGFERLRKAWHMV